MAKKNRTRSEAYSVVLEIQWEPAEESEVEVANPRHGVMSSNILGLVREGSSVDHKLRSTLSSGSLNQGLRQRFGD